MTRQTRSATKKEKQMEKICPQRRYHFIFNPPQTPFTIQGKNQKIIHSVLLSIYDDHRALYFLLEMEN